MNSAYVNELNSKNPIFQAITKYLESNPLVRELTVPMMKTITGASIKDIHEVMTAVHNKANIGRYIVGRKGNPNRFVFNHYPADVVGAALDPIHSSDPIPKKRGRPFGSGNPRIRNDANKVVPMTDTRERHMNVRVDASGFHIDISPGVNVTPHVLRMVLKELGLN
jgi:hypothetical protein